MKRGHIGLLLLALALVGALGYGFLPKAVPVDLVAVRKGPLAVTVEEEGRTRVRERYVVAAPVAGHARRIALKVGDTVVAGQMLAVIEPSRSEALDPRLRAQTLARARAAEAALAAARQEAQAVAAEAQLASQEERRAQELGKSQFLSPQAIEQAISRAKLAQARREAANQAVNVARHDLEAVRASLQKASALQTGGTAESLKVVTPIAGRLLKVMHESEGAVGAGQPLIEIGNPDSLEVEVEVLSTAAVRIAPGTRVRLDRWGGEGQLAGAVRVVEPTGFTKVSALGVEEQRVRVIVDLTSPRAQWQRLGDGYRVEAAFVIWEHPNVLIVPNNALFRHQNGWAVFVMQDGRASLRPVEIGQRSGLQAQVLSGLEEGEPVIAHPDDRVTDGVLVKARGA